jgi:hypothetical protein
MESLISTADKYGITGFFILVLCIALNKLWGTTSTRDDSVTKAHEIERKQWHDDLKENTKAIAELTSRLGTFCGDRRIKKDNEGG